MSVLEIRPDGFGWRVAPQGEDGGLCFATFDQAERHARWWAVRQEVRGVAAGVDILDTAGRLVGTWRGERYVQAAISLGHAA